MPLKPLKITFNLASRMVDPDKPIHLDGLLAWARVQQAIRADEPNPYNFGNNLPLAKETQDSLSVWKASALLFERKHVESFAFTKRNDPHDIAIKKRENNKGILEFGKKNKVDLQRGAYKQFQDFIPTIWPNKIVAYCVGDKTEIKNLLNEISFLGKYSRMGLGKIKSIQIEEDDTAHELWQQRFMPWPLDEYFPLTGKATPPYWDHNITDIFSPETIW